ncbi:MAG TPA: tRNA lysidine(34) synthetase TilS [Micromonosporaceae bacterium]|jgi:tRNA(Ile)-lysidine synthetase-like protein|nr:tRNA lysidine(34) synthetase TilS [Micromonosporaceae bacterium]
MTGPAPEVAAVRSAVRDSLRDLPAGCLVLVALSGGPDSLALAAGAAFVAPRARLRCGAVVVDHGLQAGSDAVAASAASLARGLGLDPVEVRRVDAAPRTEPGEDNPGPEAAARLARYRALESGARSCGAAAVLLGHTLDDQAETVLLRLARGSGARSLAGMPERRGIFRRPLLGLARNTTAAACRALGLTPWQDPHNHDPAYTRARVRQQALPALEQALGPGVAAALARSARLLGRDADALEGLAEEAYRRLIVDHDGAPALAVSDLAGLHQALRIRLLRRLILDSGVPAGPLSAVHLEAVDALVGDWRGQGAVALPRGFTALRRCGKVNVRPPGERTAPEEPTRARP